MLKWMACRVCILFRFAPEPTKPCCFWSKRYSLHPIFELNLTFNSASSVANFIFPLFGGQTFPMIEKRRSTSVDDPGIAKANCTINEIWSIARSVCFKALKFSSQRFSLEVPFSVHSWSFARTCCCCKAFESPTTNFDNVWLLLTVFAFLTCFADLMCVLIWLLPPSETLNLQLHRVQNTSFSLLATTLRKGNSSRKAALNFVGRLGILLARNITTHKKSLEKVNSFRWCLPFLVVFHGFWSYEGMKV